MDDDECVLLVFFGLFAIATVPMAGGNLWRLADVQLRGQWLVGVALAAQILFITILPGHFAGIHAPAHLATYGLAAAFVWVNRAIPGVWLMGIGGGVDFSALAAHGGGGAGPPRGVPPGRPGAPQGGAVGHPPPPGGGE